MLKGVEETLQVGVHRMSITFLNESIDFAKRVFGAGPGTKTVTGRLKLALEDRFDPQLHCRLHDAVVDLGIPNGRVCRPLWEFPAPDRRGSVFSALKPSLKFFQIDSRSGRQTASHSAHPLQPLRHCLSLCAEPPPWLASPYTLSDRAKTIFPPLTPSSSAANMRSLHTVASTHDQSRPWISAPVQPSWALPALRFCFAPLSRSRLYTLLAFRPSALFCFQRLSRLFTAAVP